MIRQFNFYEEFKMSTTQKSLEAEQQVKLLEVKNQQTKLKELQIDLEMLNKKVNQNEELSTEDTQFISNLGWLSALSVSLAALAAGVSM
jgi:uncharacterized protein YlxW (UPF0749 family)